MQVTESDQAGFLVALMQASDKDGDPLWYDILGEKLTLFGHNNLMIRRRVLCRNHIKIAVIKIVNSIITHIYI